MKKLIVLTGLPTSGKSTIARLIVAKYHIPFFKAVTKSYSELPHLPWDRADNYDKDLLEKQMKLDHEIRALPYDQVNILVESWHIQNYAYASIRSPDLIKDYDELIRGLINEFDIRVLYFSRTPEELVESESIPLGENVAAVLEWYRSLLNKLSEIIKFHKIPFHPQYLNQYIYEKDLPKTTTHFFNTLD